MKQLAGYLHVLPLVWLRPAKWQVLKYAAVDGTYQISGLH